VSKYYFISDVHLGYGPREEDRQRENRLVRLLDDIIEQGKAGALGGVFIVGDLFDSWFEFSSVIPRRHVRTIAALARIAELAPVEYIMGNHDFGHKDYFQKELSIPVHGTDIVRELNGKRIFIAHGDGKAANDTGYLVLRSVFRNPFLQSLYRMVHPDLGIRFAEWISGRSRLYTDARDVKRGARKPDGLHVFAEKVLERGDAEIVVMGHRHEAKIVTFENGIYINLGDWIRAYTYGVFDESGFRLEKAPS